MNPPMQEAFLPLNCQKMTDQLVAGSAIGPLTGGTTMHWKEEFRAPNGGFRARLHLFDVLETLNSQYMAVVEISGKQAVVAEGIILGETIKIQRILDVTRLLHRAMQMVWHVFVDECRVRRVELDDLCLDVMNAKLRWWNKEIERDQVQSLLMQLQAQLSRNFPNGNTDYSDEGIMFYAGYSIADRFAQFDEPWMKLSAGLLKLPFHLRNEVREKVRKELDTAVAEERNGGKKPEAPAPQAVSFHQPQQASKQAEPRRSNIIVVGVPPQSIHANLVRLVNAGKEEAQLVR